jgi:hypothetical protein
MNGNKQAGFAFLKDTILNTKVCGTQIERSSEQRAD